MAEPGDVLLYSSATHHAFAGSDPSGTETRVGILCGKFTRPPPPLPPPLLACDVNVWTSSDRLLIIGWQRSWMCEFRHKPPPFACVFIIFCDRLLVITLF